MATGGAQKAANEVEAHLGTDDTEKTADPKQHNASQDHPTEVKDKAEESGLVLDTTPVLELEKALTSQMDRLKELRKLVKAKDQTKTTPDVLDEFQALNMQIDEINEAIKDKKAFETTLKKFNQVYNKVKKTVFAAFYSYKAEIIEENIKDDIEDLEQLNGSLDSAYEACRSIQLPDNETRRRADNGQQMVQDMLEILITFQENPLIEPSKRKLLLKTTWDKAYSRSLFGSNIEKTSTVSSRSRHDRQSMRSCESFNSEKARKLAELEAQRKRTELNAKLVKHKAALESIQEQLQIVDEEERIQQSDPQEWSEPNLSEMDEKQTSYNQYPKIEKPLLSTVQEETSQLDLIAQAFSRSRIPVPTPPIFDGNPLKYLGFKRSFAALIESKGIQASDKLYYLQQYLTGEAKSAVEGCFFGSDEAAYQNAWTKLDKRFGHPFIIQRTLREKLRDWPKIAPRDGKSLLEFSDFLLTLSEAIPHVEGLNILNDYVQIQEIAAKLPEWCGSRWTRLVTTTMNEGKPYPRFKSFSEFVAQEAQVATNPICIASQAQDKRTESNPRGKDRKPSRAPGIVHATTAEGTRKLAKETSPCAYCEDKKHPIWKCPKFKETPYEGKVKFIQSKWLCFKCLNPGHPSKECQKKIICNTCKGNHHTLLHKDESPKKSPKTKYAVQDANQVAQKPADVETKSSHSMKTLRDCTPSYTSMILPVWVRTEQTGAQEVLTYALIDSQSDSSYITEELADKLSLSHQPVRMKITTLNSTSVINCKKYENVKLRGYNMNVEVCLKSCYTKEYIPHNRDHIPSKVKVSKMPHLAQVAPHIPPLQDCDVGLLIGYSCPHALRPVEIVSGDAEAAFAVKTDLGWSVVGGPSYLEDDYHLCHRVIAKEMIMPPPCDVIKVLDQDFKDTNDEINVSQEDLKFLQILEAGIKVKETGRISMPLPLKGNLEIPNNHGMALSRLNSLKRKLMKNERFKKHYSDFMEEMFSKGYAEKIEPAKQEEMVNYIPHQGVYHPHKPDKIRVVFDGSAKCKGMSLNDTLLKGPDLTNGLIGVLLRFRQERIALTCDIEQMFYNFEVHKEHRNLLRFLWWPKGDLQSPPSEYRLTVHLFGAASSPGCANYALKYLARQHSLSFPKAAPFLTKNFYVDDGLQSLPNAQEAIHLVREATELCKKGNIRLHKFLSNSKEVLEAIPLSERAATVSEINLEMDALPVERTLGVRWDIQEDCFIFKVTVKDNPCTRRGILSSVMSVYDPTGFVSPVVLRGRQILQELCRQKKSWDEPIDTHMVERWEVWKNDLVHLESLKIPRCVKPAQEVSTYELHHFSDASTTGYGQCSYLRMNCQDGSIACTLLISKSRVAPSKVISIPRLELSAAVLSVKIAKLLKRELDIPVEKEYFWTDSKVVLGYIANEAKRFHVFVSNRVQYIRDNTQLGQWQYVPTKFNPADLASRGVTARELQGSCWQQGPEFLKEAELPLNKVESNLVLGDPEVKSNCLSGTSATLPTGFVEKLNDFSRWQNMITALSVLIKKVKTNASKADVRQSASNKILTWVQNKAFPEEKLALQRKETVPSTSCLADLCPMLDESGLMRVGGRLRKSKQLSSGERHPIILPRKSHVTKTIIEDVHVKTNHGGRSFTLGELRAQGYYVHRGSKKVAQVIKECVTCRKIRRTPEVQKMADLPEERTEQHPIFYHSGMDVFGPYTVKRARSEVKRYGLIFTCLYSRAIHVELLDDLSTDCFINALRCFLALRGVVKAIFCDQGTNFVGADNELRQALSETSKDKLETFLARKQIEFKFNAPHASEQSGVWERQIRTVRSVLKSVIDFANTRLDDSSLRTFFYEATYMVNNRPLSTVSLNDPLSAPPVTPNALLHGKLEGVLPPPGAFCAQDVYARKRWRRVQYLSDQFWKSWKKEYLLDLQKRQKWSKPQRNLKVGDVVLVVDENAPRGQWPMALITDVKKDQDGLVRKLQLRVSNARSVEKGEKKKVISDLERPVQKVVLLLPAAEPSS